MSIETICASDTAEAAPSALKIPYEACPLCNHGEADELGQWDAGAHPLWHPPLPRTLRWLRCCGCGHVFTDSYYSDVGLRELFRYAQQAQLAGGNLDAQRATWAPIVDSVLRWLRADFGDGKTWLDVGCGNGALVFTAAEYGFDAVGLDAREQAAAGLESLGYAAIVGDVHDLKVERGSLDVVSLADVIEHVPFPGRVLTQLRSQMSRDGVLFISCPNSDCASWRLMDRTAQNPYWIELEHHHNFSRRHLFRLLADSGFKPVAYGVSPRYKACMQVFAQPAQ